MIQQNNEYVIKYKCYVVVEIKQKIEEKKQENRELVEEYVKTGGMHI